jgi:hypothetical protein
VKATGGISKKALKALHPSPSNSLDDLDLSSDHSTEPLAMSLAAELIPKGEWLGVESITSPLVLDFVTSENRVQTTDRLLEIGIGDSTT